MSHEISITESGRAEAFYALTPAWHGLGVVTKDALCWEDAAKAAHLCWEVEQIPLYAGIAGEKIKTPDGEIEGAPKFMQTPVVGNFRSDNRAFLGTVSDRYVPIDNIEAFRFLDGFVKDGSIKFESAGALRSGKTIWCLARMPEIDTITEGDDLNRYLLFTTNHDGCGAARVMPTSVRVVCQNTLSMALASRESSISIRHAGNVQRQMDAAQVAFHKAGENFAEYARMARLMVGQKMERGEFEAYLDLICPEPESNSVRQINKAQKMRDAIRTAMWNDDRQRVGDTFASVWGAYNAVTQVVDHTERRGADQTAKAETRMKTVLFGEGDSLKQSAWAKASELIGA